MSRKQITPQTRAPVSGEYPFLPFPLCSPKSRSRDPCSCSSLSARVWIKIFPPSLSGDTCLYAHLHSSVFCFQKCVETITDTPGTAFFHLPSYLPFVLYHLDIKNDSLTLSLSKQITSTGHCWSAREEKAILPPVRWCTCRNAGVGQMCLLLGVAGPSVRLKIIRTSFVMLKANFPDNPRDYFLCSGPPTHHRHWFTRP